MAGFIREHFGSLVFSILLHGAIVAALIFGFIKFNEKPAVQPAPQLPIEATVVDEKKINAEVQRQEQEKQLKEQQMREQAERVKKQQEEEQQKLEDLKRQREQEEQAERQRTEQRQKEEEQRRIEAEAQAKAEAERKKKAEAERKAREDETKRKAAEARQRAEREAELKRRMAEEERRQSAVDSGLLAQYIGQIKTRIQRAWIRPPGIRPDLKCEVIVTQVPGGEVVGVQMGECNADAVWRQSIEAAVYRASPLPQPPDPTLFDRTLRLEFTAND